MLSGHEITLAIFGAVVIGVMGENIKLKSKNLGYLTHVILSVVFSVLIYQYTDGISNFLSSFFLAASAYCSILVLFEDLEKYLQLKKKLDLTTLEILPQKRNFARILTDIIITLVVTSGMLLAIFLTPEEAGLMKYMASWFLISIYINLVRRIYIYYTTEIYLDADTETLFIISKFASKELPLKDLSKIYTENTPDILRLHPLFIYFTSHEDYTVNNEEVLSLVFPGVQIYLTVENRELWIVKLLSCIKTDKEPANVVKTEDRKVIPLWHPKVYRRLLGKGYYAVTVKGFSAYVGLTLLLEWLGAPIWLSLVCILAWWIFNLAISDRILVIAMDGEEIKEGQVYETAQNVFQRAQLKKVRLYKAETQDYNAMAMGANVGRGMIVLTSATLNLSAKDLEGIIAHEAVHVKKGDVLVSNVLRLLFMITVGSILFNFSDPIQSFAKEHFVLTFILAWLTFPFFLIYQSLISQFMEVRADFMGSDFLRDGSEQMAESLRQLALHQDKDLEKSLSYSVLEPKRKNKIPLYGLKRPKWFWRILEFQFMFHPPMYWRVQSLESNVRGYRFVIVKKWFIDRFRESIPYKILGKRKVEI